MTAVDRDPSAPGFRWADRRAIISVDDERGVELLARAGRVDGVVAPGRDSSVGIAARVAAKLGIGHPVAPDVAALTVHRARQRERLAAAGVPQPRWRLVGDAVVDEPVAGAELSLIAWSGGGRFVPLIATERVRAPAVADVWPVRAGAAQQAAAIAEAAAAALGVRAGLTTTRFRVGDGCVAVDSVSARVVGAHAAGLCATAVGVDPAGLAVAAALGEEPDGEALQAVPLVGGACGLTVPRAPAAAEAVVVRAGATRDEALQRAASAAALIRFGTSRARAPIHT